ncbi:MAG: sigma-70 family RNA polymerase sigma factor [Alistipes sp.]|uniref:RNA polymerase sigma factor n=1 Tax=Alistipes sp. TaxID=1872444 RepID=UPI0025B9A1A8|nr:sigma-70 family RNA polymerase sigma factor [Alistipes sp.]MCD8274769.1 sigma-70 family RNA polymerase sigma factor [Alistipes sp.]
MKFWSLEFADKNRIHAALYRKHVNDLYNYGRGLGFDDETCMDAIHDVFCKLCSLEETEIKKIRNVKFFIFRCLKNRLIDIRKARKPYLLGQFENLPFTIEVKVRENQNEVEEYEYLKSKVKNLLSQLTDRQREAIYLRYIQEMEYEDIGLLLGMEPGSVRKLVFRGIGKLRSQVGTDTLLLFTLYHTLFP